MFNIIGNYFMGMIVFYFDRCLYFLGCNVLFVFNFGL